VRISSFEPLWRKAYERKLTVKQRVIELLEVRAMKSADNVYAPSMRIARTVQSAINRPVAAIEPVFIYDADALDYGVYNATLGGKNYLLFFGTVGSMKGCKEIAEILHPLLDKYRDLHFVFIGPAATEHSERMKEYVLLRAGDLNNRVFFLNPLKHEFLYSIIKESRAVVLPSRIDNFPNTCVEAMSLGQIVIGTDGTSFEELIEDGISGFLCKPNDRESLMNAVVRVLELTAEQRVSISAHAQKRIERLAPDFTIRNLINYYTSVIESWKDPEKKP
jgi:glycosyltransferase involved in cell wall biosynthesis